jgi:hypothetical protein
VASGSSQQKLFSPPVSAKARQPNNPHLYRQLRTWYSARLMDTLQRDSAARKVTVLLDENLSRRLSEYCAAEGFKKSTLFVKLLRAHLDEARRQPRARRGRQLLNQRATA